MNAEKYHNTRPIPPLSFKDQKRFWSKVKIDSLDACWEWQSGRSEKGYGTFYVGGGKGGQYRAQRVAFFLFNSESPSHPDILHDCDNKCCVNPNHLHPGSIEQNAREALERNRYLRGERNPLHKLTEIDVKNIRRVYSKGGTSLNAIAAQYSLNDSAIWQVVAGKRWKHIPVVDSKVTKSSRLARGERVGTSILTEMQVREILEIYASGQFTQTELGRLYGVTQSAIWLIVRRKNWAHIRN